MLIIFEFSLEFWADLCVRIGNPFEGDRLYPMPEVHLLGILKNSLLPQALLLFQIDFELIWEFLCIYSEWNDSEVILVWINAKQPEVLWVFQFSTAKILRFWKRKINHRIFWWWEDIFIMTFLKEMVFISEFSLLFWASLCVWIGYRWGKRWSEKISAMAKSDIYWVKNVKTTPYSLLHSKALQEWGLRTARLQGSRLQECRIAVLQRAQGWAHMI